MRKSQLRNGGFYGGLPSDKMIVPPRSRDVSGIVNEAGERIEEYHKNTPQVQELEMRRRRRHSREQQVQNDQRAALERQQVIRDHEKGTSRNRRSETKLYTFGRTSPVGQVDRRLRPVPDIHRNRRHLEE